MCSQVLILREWKKRTIGVWKLSHRIEACLLRVINGTYRSPIPSPSPEPEAWVNPSFEMPEIRSLWPVKADER